MSIAKFDNEDFHTKSPNLLVDLAKHTVSTEKELAGIDEQTTENIGMVLVMKIGLLGRFKCLYVKIIGIVRL